MVSIDRGASAPEFSVIIPVYNTEQYLESCLRSVLNQTETSLEVIAIDDGSTDGSKTICDRLAEEDDRLVVVSQLNSGQGVARNRGLDLACGRFVLFVDSDDQIEPDLCSSVLSLIDDDTDFLGFGVDFVDQSGRRRSPVPPYSVSKLEGPEIFAAALLDHNVLTAPWSKVYRRATIEANAVRFPPIRAWEDSYFSREIARVSRVARFDNTPRYHALIRPGSTSRSIDSQKFVDALALFEIEKQAFARELKDPHTAVLFDAHIVKFLTHLLVLAALRTATWEKYIRCFEVADGYGYQRRRRDPAVMGALSTKVRVAAALAGRPAVLRAMSVAAGWIGLRPY